MLGNRRNWFDVYDKRRIHNIELGIDRRSVQESYAIAINAAVTGMIVAKAVKP